MFVAIFYVTVCSGWLCKAVHGEEVIVRTEHRFETFDECVSTSAEAAAWAIPPEFKFRVECREIAKP